MLGAYLAVSCSLGYVLASSVMARIFDTSARLAVGCAIVASAFTYIFFAAGYLDGVDGMNISSLSLLGAASAISFSMATVLCRKFAKFGRRNSS